jgi:ArsR family transcriptional regulator
MPAESLLSVVVQTFDALADPTRARIAFALSAGELCVRDLALAVGVSESAVSHQMRLLRDRHLVRSRRDGTTIYYTVDGHHLSVLLREADYHADHVHQDLPDHSYPRADPGA